MTVPARRLRKAQSRGFRDAPGDGVGVGRAPAPRRVDARREKQALLPRLHLRFPGRRCRRFPRAKGSAPPIRGFPTARADRCRVPHQSRCHPQSDAEGAQNGSVLRAAAGRRRVRADHGRAARALLAPHGNDLEPMDQLQSAELLFLVQLVPSPSFPLLAGKQRSLPAQAQEGPGHQARPERSPNGRAACEQAWGAAPAWPREEPAD